MEAKRIYLPDVVGKGYKEFWNFRGRYRVLKGSRASKKSKTTALWFIYNLMKYPESNLLVIRKTFRTLKDSCYTELKWAANRLGVSHLWSFTLSPLEATYKPTGQKIYFRGLDDPLKITSIAVETGFLCWAWLEECYEVTKEEDFDFIDESIRGDTGDLFKQITLTFNPWNERHWLKHRFFDDVVGHDEDGNPIYKARTEHISKDGQILAITTNYKINEWLDDADRAMFEQMRQNNPRRYKVAGLGDWGVVEGLVYENWQEMSFTLDTLPKDAQRAFGLDFGYTNDPTALFCGFISEKERKIYVWDEIYEKGLSNKQIADKIKVMGYGREQITGDSEDPRTINELQQLGLFISGAKKGRDSVSHGIQWIQNYKIIVHPRCVNFLTEIGMYIYKRDKFDNLTNNPEDANNHLMDAMRYALEKWTLGNDWWY